MKLGRQEKKIEKEAEKLKQALNAHSGVVAPVVEERFYLSHSDMLDVWDAYQKKKMLISGEKKA